MTTSTSVVATAAAASTAARRFMALLSPARLAAVAREPAVAERVSALLFEHNVCPRCILRYLGIRDRDDHFDIPSRFSSNGVVKMHVPSLLPTGLQYESRGVKRERDDDQTGPAAKVLHSIAIASPNSTAGEADSVGAATVLAASAATTERGAPTAVASASASESRAAINGTERQWICPACIGLLQIDFCSLAQKAAEVFRREAYTLSEQASFNIASRLPPQLSIRQRAFALLIQHTVGVSDETSWSTVEVKEIFRALATRSIEDSLQLPADKESPFIVQIHMEHSETAKEYEFMTSIPEAEFKIKKTKSKRFSAVPGASGEKIAKAVSKLSYDHFAGSNMCPPPAIHLSPILQSLDMYHEPIFVAGRYNKYQRGISNSPWEINGQRMAEYSVEELVAGEVDKYFRNTEHRFSSAGREDVDVLTLGRGRPFYLELVNPHVTVAPLSDMRKIQERINTAADGKIHVRDLQIVTRESTKILKDSASTKSKSYSVLVQLSEDVTLELLEELSKITNLAVKQQNPTRVPRRADLCRDKVIHNLTSKFEPTESGGGKDDSTNGAGVASGHLIRVDMRTSAGTYVKEFVHGDCGRTFPNLASLLGVAAAEVVALDVLEVHLDWPPQIDDLTLVEEDQREDS
ncbi:putative tRNA pseudouridine synthase Pus10 [Borealophlyctis nickersoniae]|nr:putative tRNA pseudouridine synthase Pus10 [Borealophlyctis nickersoniae]